MPDLPAATAAAKEAAAAAPDAPQPHYILGLIAKSENQADVADAEFGKVLAFDNTDLGARVNLAQLAMQKREYDRALELLRPAVAAEPYHVTALYNLGVALTRAGKTEEGQQTIAKFQALREAGYGTAFSNNYLEQGRYAEAVASTGAESALVDASAAPVTFSIGPLVGAAEPGGGAALVDLDRRRRPRSGRRPRPPWHLPERRRHLPRRVGGARCRVAGDAAGPDHRGGRRLRQRRAVDLFVLGTGRHALLHQRADGTFEDTTAAAGIPATAGVHGAVAFVDADHDGDLDLVLAGATPVLLRNNGNGTFTDVSAASKIAAAAGVAAGLVPTDFDNRRDVDLLVARASGAPVLLKNLRDGSFADVSADVGLAAIAGAARVTAVAAGDVNKDGFTDFFFARADTPGMLAASTGRGTFAVADVAGTEGVTAAQFVDLDNDGLLDLAAVTAAGPIQLRGLGVRASGGQAVPAWGRATPLLAPATQPGRFRRSAARPGWRRPTSTATATPIS